MVPGRESPCGDGRTAPRTCGDGPAWSSSRTGHSSCSPRLRGSSRGELAHHLNHHLLPAPAGMVPASAGWRGSGRAALRARGDDPDSHLHQYMPTGCSPRLRGWSLLGLLALIEVELLPAPARMVPAPRNTRTRGKPCSPRPRGWSRPDTDRARGQSLLPALAGMVLTSSGRRWAARSAPRARGDGPEAWFQDRARRDCSPRPQGWSRCAGLAGGVAVLLPAPVGMVPGRPTARPRWRSAPRARGDGPVTGAGYSGQANCSPAGGRHFGCSPRPRDGSHRGERLEDDADCSPRPRGWSRLQLQQHGPSDLLPAHAGMVPRFRSRRWSRCSAPRARGDSTQRPALLDGRVLCSPRPWGWSLAKRREDGRVRLLPAPAGMVPNSSTDVAPRTPAPCARGDGPERDTIPLARLRCSPRPQGWSHQTMAITRTPSSTTNVWRAALPGRRTKSWYSTANGPRCGSSLAAQANSR